jgi:nucleotide sugar dehydrogenase
VSERIAVIGSGYVGTVAAACFAHVGHQVVAVESDAEKLAQLEKAKAPFHEPGLNELLANTLESGHLSFTSDLAAATAASDIIFFCVGTPPGANGQADMSAVAAAGRLIADNLHHHHVIVTKSTVPVGTGRWLRSLMEDRIGSAEEGERLFSVVSNPEFLREGSAVQDFLHPDRIIVGSDDPAARDVVVEAYRPILDQQIPGETGRHDPVPLVQTRLATAEMTKYASNSFLAAKVSFANEVARLCEFVGADVTEVMAGIGLDSRIGGRYLEAGIGWGGSCLGKDLSALISTAEEYGYRPRLLEAVVAVNEGQRQLAVDELLRHLKTVRGARVCLLGLAFKSGTDDLRDSPGLDIARRLVQRGAFVTAFDPMVSTVADDPEIRTVGDPLTAARGADAVVITTDWPQFLTIDLANLRQLTRGDVFFDGRNLFNPQEVRRAGFRYIGIGRPSLDGHQAENSMLITESTSLIAD